MRFPSILNVILFKFRTAYNSIKLQNEVFEEFQCIPDTVKLKTRKFCAVETNLQT